VSNLFKKYYDVSKLVIWGDDASDSDNARKPKLVLSFRDGNPRFTVYTGTPGQEGVISFPSDYPTLVGVLSLLKDIARGPAGEKFAVDSLTAVYVDNKPTNEKKIVSTLYVGKSKEGLVYFSIIAENKPKIIFTIKSSPYHAYRDNSKNSVPESVLSEKLAIGLADLMLNVISAVLVNYTNEAYANGVKQTQIKGESNSQAVSKEILQDLDDLAL